MMKFPEKVPEKQQAALKALCDFFQTFPIHGMYANGSIATQTMDEFSDLDLTLTFCNQEDLLACWDFRRHWKLPLIHQFDADHRKKNFVVLIFENGVKADVYLTTPGSIRPKEKPPFFILHDPSGELALELNYTWNRELPSDAAVLNCLQEDEKFWGWFVFEYNHFHRGDLYLLADDFFVFRKMLQSWLGLLVAGKVLTAREFQDHPELENWKNRFKQHLFPNPDKKAQWESHQKLIEFALEIRSALTQLDPRFRWKVSEQMILHVRRLFQV